MTFWPRVAPVGPWRNSRVPRAPASLKIPVPASRVCSMCLSAPCSWEAVFQKETPHTSWGDVTCFVSWPVHLNIFDLKQGLPWGFLCLPRSALWKRSCRTQNVPDAHSWASGQVNQSHGTSRDKIQVWIVSPDSPHPGGSPAYS